VIAITDIKKRIHLHTTYAPSTPITGRLQPG